jgi:hypothetical protein
MFDTLVAVVHILFPPQRTKRRRKIMLMPLLLGAIEASTGVLMFGVSAGVVLAVVSRILTRDVRFGDCLDEIK